MTSPTLPAHVAVIMDGNGRWAKQRGMARTEGHRAGTETARLIYRHAVELGLGYFTMYAFSRENWLRPPEEVGFLFGLVRRFFSRRELAWLQDRGARLHILGELDEVPDEAREILSDVVAQTAHNTGTTINLALNYSGREEILRACRRMLAQGLAPDELDESAFRTGLYTAGQPDPDLIIRTSGEHRLSNYLIFQAAYAELYFTDTLWPDFTPAELDRALEDFAHRQRRFGKTDEQLCDEDASASSETGQGRAAARR